MAFPDKPKGRGSSENLANRFEKIAVILDPEIDVLDEFSEVPSPKTVFFKDSSKSIIATNESPDVGFEASVNPYRGCEHGCIYCYARPTHEYLGFSSGLDFETKIMVKEEAPELLRKALASPSWDPKTISISGVTDAYQPVERKLKLTRRCLEVLTEFRNPTFLITKNFLITRDLDLLRELAQYSAAGVLISITTLEDSLCSKMEPRTSRPRKRLEAISQLATAGIPVGVNVAPTIPGLTDHEMPEILKQARENGASFAGYTMVRFPLGVSTLFEKWIRDNFPDREKKILNRLHDIRAGKTNDSRFGSRMTGEGVFADQTKHLFKLWVKRLGYGRGPQLSEAHFRRPHDPRGQLPLF